ncbi:glycosyltransferase [Patescibacteria group bacterium]|nr:glycosyltransferase [Patescibacteria group bacterium]
MVDIYIPTLRCYKIPDIIKNLTESTSKKIDIFFILEKDDFNKLSGKYPVILNEGSPSYSGAINTAYKKTSGDYFFCGADDLLFHKNWLEIALEKMDGNIMVVGTNDLFNKNVLSGNTSTHSLVNRDYIKKYGGTMDGSFPVLFEYKHNYCDTEFVQTAKKRGVFSPCLESIVEHMHWGNGKSPRDEVYTKGDATVSLDQQTFNERQGLWS